MDQLALIIGLLLATVVAVGLGDRLRLPYPVLMLILAVALTFIPGFPDLEIPPELILPIFLPPLLFATAQRSSWAVFRVRWRTLIMLAVALVVISTAVVAGAAWLMIPGIGIPAAIALGAQAAVAAAVSGTRMGPDVVLNFVLGAALAVVAGIAMGWLTALITRLVQSMVARSAVTLVVPFAAYILAEEFHASGVIAVVVTALEMQRHARPQDAAERVTRTAFWDVVELLVTGLAFGLVGLEIQDVVREEGSGIFGMVGTAVVVCVLVFAVRFGWLGLLALSSRKRKNLLQPTSAKEVLILTWCGMRGLATLALALALPLTLADGTPFPARDQLLVIACAVLLATLVLPGLTLPWLMRVLKASQDGTEERDAARLLARRAQAAAVAALQDHELVKELPPEKVALVKEKMNRLHAELLDGSLRNETLAEKRERGRELAITVQTIALDAARQEVVAARNESDMDPEVADRVLRQLDLRTMIMPE